LSGDRPTIFIGSSKEGLSIAEAVADQLKGSLQVTPWSSGVFGLGTYTLEALLARAHEFDFAALVFSPDDQTVSRGADSPSPRDNVVFEAGLFMGRLGRERTFVIYDSTSSVRVPSDLAGITVATFCGARDDDNLLAAVDDACRTIKRHARKLGRLPGRGSRAADEQPASTGLRSLLPYDFMISNKATDAWLDAWRDNDGRWHIHGVREYHGGANQRWRIHQMTNDDAIIILAEGELALDGYEDNGWNVHVWPYHGEANQRWRLDRRSDHTYRIARADNSNLCLGTERDGDAIRITLEEWDSSDSQRWWINPVPHG
jgi:hypothetical protein